MQNQEFHDRTPQRKMHQYPETLNSLIISPMPYVPLQVSRGDFGTGIWLPIRPGVV